MEFIKWSKDYELGIPAMDEQHRMWITYINHFYESLAQKCLEVALKERLQNLIDYTDFHFVQEEQFLKSAAYPFWEEHHNHHKNIRITLFEYYSKCVEGRLIVSNTANSEMRKWLLLHILEDDKKYAQYLRVLPGLS